MWDTCAAQIAACLGLFLAARQGRADIARELLRAGIDTNQAAAGGWTPLHEAVARGHAEMVTLLIAHHAPLDAARSAGRPH